MIRTPLALLLAAFVLPGAQEAPREYNVRDFGAKGDKSANDRGAIQRAVDACAAAGGGTVRGVLMVPGADAGKSPVLDLQDCRDLKVE
jgi:hypothetical protein